MPLFIPETTASFPGWLILSRWKFARYETTNPLVAGLRYTASFIPLAVAVLTRVGLKAVTRWRLTQEYFRIGCLAPSMLVDRDAGLVATFMNISNTGVGHVPVIQLRREPRHLLPRDLRAGARLASVCIFYETPASRGTGQWAEFEPYAIDCLVDDPAARTRAQARLPATAWQALDAGLAQLRDVRAPGMYPVAVPDALTDGAFEPQPETTPPDPAADPNGSRPTGQEYLPEFEPWISRTCQRATLWLHATLDDNVATIIYLSLFVLLIAAGLGWMGVTPVPPALCVAPLSIAAALLVARAVRNWRFIGQSTFVLGEVGAQGTRFRKWVEHQVHYTHRGETHTIKHTFLAKEVAPKEEILLLVHNRNPRKFLVARRARDTDALIAPAAETGESSASSS